MVAQLAKIFFAQAKQRRAIKFGISADVVIGVRMQCFAVFVLPHFMGVVAALEVDGLRAPVFFSLRT